MVPYLDLDPSSKAGWSLITVGLIRQIKEFKTKFLLNYFHLFSYKEKFVLKNNMQF